MHARRLSWFLLLGAGMLLQFLSFSDKDLEDSAKRAVHQRMVGCAPLELYFNRLSVSTLYYR